jgi:hypothetical protein
MCGYACNMAVSSIYLLPGASPTPSGELDTVSDTIARLTGNQPQTLRDYLHRHPESYRHLVAALEAVPKPPAHAWQRRICADAASSVGAIAPLDPAPPAAHAGF